MRRNPELRQATREASQNLDNLRIVTPKHSPEVAVLSKELRKSLAKSHRWISNEARWMSRRAKESSSRHRRELMEIMRAGEAAVKATAAKMAAKSYRRG